MESSHKSQSTHSSYKMAWTAYIRPFIVFVFISLIGPSVYVDGFHTAGMFICIFAVVLLIYQVLSIRSILLFTDDEGVWVFSGIFPWSRGTFGVKWRDIEDAVYTTGFWSWALKSYTVRIGHRFTKSSEIVLPHIARGDAAVMHINAFHSQVLALAREA